MHRFNNPTISSNFNAVRTVSKQTVLMTINNIATASKPNHANTDREFILIFKPTRI